jgi:hypothetical protein
MYRKRCSGNKNYTYDSQVKVMTYHANLEGASLENSAGHKYYLESTVCPFHLCTRPFSATRFIHLHHCRRDDETESMPLQLQRL